METASDLGASAIRRLAVGMSTITSESVNTWPSRPGLYAVYGASEVWHTLQLGDPPDDRPLYVGKAERSLSSRDVATHFGFAGGGSNSITGSSTLRRSVSALLRVEHGFRGRFRNPEKPEKPANFGLSRDHDSALSLWMRNNLLATYWEMTCPSVTLEEVETVVLDRLKPPLNIQKVSHQWTKQVRAARSLMAADCGKG